MLTRKRISNLIHAAGFADDLWSPAGSESIGVRTFLGTYVAMARLVERCANMEEAVTLLRHAEMLPHDRSGKKLIYWENIGAAQQVPPRFRLDNTTGYAQSDLDALNRAFETIMDDSADVWAGWFMTGDAFKSWQDHVAERLLARYDAGERGESLER